MKRQGSQDVKRRRTGDQMLRVQQIDPELEYCSRLVAYLTLYHTNCNWTGILSSHDQGPLHAHVHP